MLKHAVYVCIFYYFVWKIILAIYLCVLFIKTAITRVLWLNTLHASLMICIIYCSNVSPLYVIVNSAHFCKK